MAKVNASRINDLQSRIALMLGNGTGFLGYGQTVESSQVSPLGGIVLASDLNAIYADILTARIHQVGLRDFRLAEVIANLNVVAEETSFFITDDGIQLADDEPLIPDDPNSPTRGQVKGILDFERVMNDAEADRFMMAQDQATLAPAISSSRSSTWNGLIEHDVIVTFTDEDHRRHFFNSGGEIRFAASNDGAVTPKGLDWAELTSSIGTVIFNYDSTRSLADGAITMIGNYELTGAYQTIYEKIGSGTYSSIYAGNVYAIRAREDAPNRISFNIRFNDLVTDPVVDNDVDGTLESVVQQLYANNPTGVAVPPPSFFNQRSL